MNGSRSTGSDFARRLFRNRLAAAGGAVILFFFLLSALPGVFSSHEPNRIDIVNILRPPSASHPLGTDDLEIFLKLIDFLFRRRQPRFELLVGVFHFLRGLDEAFHV